MHKILNRLKVTKIFLSVSHELRFEGIRGKGGARRETRDQL